MKKVAVTGGLACGKSTACHLFKEMGAHVVSADEIVHKLLSPQTSLGQQVITLLGGDIVVDDKIDRSAIAVKVFNNRALLQALEKLLHPAVFNKVEEEYQIAKTNNKATLFVAEIPLLFETGGERHFDATIAVYANPEECKRRFLATTGTTEEEYDKRMKNQLSAEEKAQRATYVIQNQGNIQELRSQIERIFQQLSKNSKS